jgi:hypothetical protein
VIVVIVVGVPFLFFAASYLCYLILSLLSYLSIYLSYLIFAAVDR